MNTKQDKIRNHTTHCSVAAWAAFLLPGLLSLSCLSQTPRYTPQSVVPPRSIEAARARIEEDHAPAPESGIPPATAESDAMVDTGGMMSGLGLEEAISHALTHNRALKVQSFSPEIAQKAIAEARAAFDPSLTLSVEYSDRKTPGDSGAGSGNTSSGIQSGVSSGDGSLAQVTTAFQSLIQQSQQVYSVMQSGSASVNQTRGLSASGKLSQPLPTGTDLYFSSGFSRSESSMNDAADYNGDWSIGVTQSLLRGFGTRVNLVSLRSARNDAASSRMAFQHYLIQLAGQVESAYWGLSLAQETLRIRQFSLELAEEQLNLNEALIAVGKLSGSARISAEAEVASQKAQLVDAEASLKTRAVELWHLMNPEGIAADAATFPEIMIPDATDTELSLQESTAFARLFRPDLAQAKLDVANGELAVVQTKNGLLPDLTAFASYGLNSGGAGAAAWRKHLDDTTYGQFQVGLSFNVALGNRAERARHQRARLQEAQAESALHALEQQVEAEVYKSHVEVSRQAEQIVASYQELLSRTEELAVETEQFRLGRSTNLNVLLVQQKLVQAKVQEATARVRLLQALSAVYQAEGTLLTRRGIVVQEEKESM